MAVEAGMAVAMAADMESVGGGMAAAAKAAKAVAVAVGRVEATVAAMVEVREVVEAARAEAIAVEEVRGKLRLCRRRR